jgi:hypothetical protein
MKFRDFLQLPLIDTSYLLGQTIGLPKTMMLMMVGTAKYLPTVHLQTTSSGV